MADILEWKLTWLGITLSPLALFGWLRKRTCSKGRLLRRFRTVLKEHDLEPVELLQLLPPDIKANAADLLDDEKVLGILDDDVPSWLAKTFAVRRAWLGGRGDQVYDRMFAYKALDRFFGDLERQGLLGPDLQPFILYEQGRLLTDRANWHQMPVLVLVHSFAELEDRTIRRFVICGDSWNYVHPPCRAHLKAIVRVFYKAFRKNTFLVPVTQKRLTATREGKLIPSWLTEQVGGLDMYEECALSPEESLIAQETKELPMVLDLIDKSSYVKGLLEQGWRPTVSSSPGPPMVAPGFRTIG